MSYNKTTNINVNDLKFSRTKSSGRKFVNVFYDKQALGIRLPKLRLPFDSQLSRFNQLEFNLSFDKNEELISWFENLDKVMLDFAEEHEWLNKDLEYVPTLKASKGGNFPPTIKLKVPQKDQEIKTTFFDADKNKIKISNPSDVLDVLKKNTVVLSAIECVGVWFIENRWGLSWKCEQIRVIDNLVQESKKIDNYAFQEDSDSDTPAYTELLIDDE